MPLYEMVCLVRTHDVARRHLAEVMTKVRALERARARAAGGRAGALERPARSIQLSTEDFRLA